MKTKNNEPMKKITILLLCVSLSVFAAKAQKIEDFFQKYKSNKDVEYIHIAPELLKITSKLAALAVIFDGDIPKENKEIIHLLDDLEDFEFMVSANKDINLQKELKKQKIFKSGKYKLLSEVSQKEQNIRVYTEGTENDIIRNFVIVLEDKDDDATILANVKGEVKLERIMKIIELSRKKAKNKA